MLISAGAWHAYDQDYLYKAIMEEEDRFGRINEEDITARIGVFALAGPKARDVLKALVVDAEPETVLGNKRFPWLSSRDIELKMCPLNAVRVAYTGELGWGAASPDGDAELPVRQLMEAGEPHGLKLVGARAQNWLRQESHIAHSERNSAATQRRSKRGLTGLWTRPRSFEQGGDGGLGIRRDVRDGSGGWP